MQLLRRSSLLLICFCLLPLISCANSPLGQSLQKSLEADARLRTSASPSAAQPVATTSPVPTAAQAQLPPDFPREIPLYGDRELRSVTPAAGAAASGSEVTTGWVSADSSDRVLAFYLQQLQVDKWQILERPNALNQGTIVARLNNLTLRVKVQPSPAVAGKTSDKTSDKISGKTSDNTQPATEFELRYQSGGTIGQTPGTSPSPDRINGGISANSPTANPSPAQPNLFSDLDKAPKELRQYAEDLAKLGVLSPGMGEKAGAKKGDGFDPNAEIPRRDYARWLFAANNRLYATRTNLQLRPGSTTAAPAFQDVPRTDPDFAAIQGLAEAGIVVSPLSGDSTAVVFRPDAPLTREEMVLWKVPLDTHQPLPNASLEAVQQTWGFEDTAKIAPRSLRAVLVDFQNGNQSNIRRAFGYTTIFQPKKSVSRAQAAAALWYFGYQSEGVSAQEALKGAQAAKQGG